MDDDATLVSDSGRGAVSSPYTAVGTGTRVDRYTIGRELGRGAMGIVYEADDPTLGRLVAIKVLQGYAGEQERHELIREARASAQLSSPFVIEVFAVAIAGDGTPCVVTEFVDGRTLREWLQATSKRRSEVLDAFEDAAEGLAAIHEASIVHRDFKPDNVIMGRDGRLRIADFGLARGGTSLTRALSNDDAAMVTDEFESAEDQTGRRLLGTPAYMAPELFAHASATAASDQFAYCVSLFEALVGHRPFRGRTPAEIAAEQLSDQLVVPSSVPSELAKVLRRGLARDPAARFGSMAALLEELRRARARVRRRRWAVVAAVGAAVPALLLVGHPVPTVDRCKDPGQDPGAEWSAARASVDAKLRALGGHRSEEAAARIVARIDEWASDLGVAQHEVCLVAPREGEGQQRRRRACLEEARVRGQAFVDVLDRLDLDAIDPATRAVHTLPRPLRCLGSVATLPSGSDAAVSVRVRAYNLQFRAQVGELDLLAETTELVREAEHSSDALTHTVALRTLGDVAARERQPERAEAALTEAAKIAESAQLDSLRGAIAFQHARLVGVRGNDFERGQELARAAIDLSRVRNPELAARATIRLGVILRRAGEPEAGRDVAESGVEALERRVTSDDPVLLQGYSALSGMEFDLGNLQRANELARLAAELAAELLGETHAETMLMLNNAVVLRSQAGDAAGALELAEDLHQRRVTVLGSEHPETAASWQNLAALRQQDGQAEAAIESARRAVEAYRVLEPGGRDVAEARVALGVMLASAGRTDEARDAMEGVYADLVSLLGAEHPGTLVAGLQWAELLGKLGRDDEVEPLVESLGEVAANHPTHFVASNALMLRARQRMGAGDDSGAQADIEGAIASLRGPTSAPQHRAELGRWLEMIGWAPSFDWSP